MLVSRTVVRARAHRRTVAQALVLSLVVAGTAAFASLHKTVTLDVDGDVRTVSAFGRTVGDVLEAHDVVVGPRDLVSPGTADVVGTRQTVVVRHGREVDVVVDGDQRTVWTTALTVEEMVAELGLRDQAVRTSASRSSVLGREPLAVSTVKTVHVAADGATQDLTTQAATVREVLVEAGVVLGPYDRLSAPLDSAVADGMVVLVTRVRTETRSERTETPFATVREDDPRLVEGREVVEVEGRTGVSVTTFVAQLVGDEEVGRTVLAESVVTAPVDQVVRVGTMTMPDPADLPSVEPGTARAIGLEMTLARGWDEAEFACLDNLWTKESGWRTTAENRSSGAYGIPQALPGSKMASAGDDWRTNPATQIAWGLGYIENRYDTPCGAWSFFLSRNYY
ncbi:DUF348 domain-containing protein [Cellulomonas sp. APG4]|nr:DUF348 domain-containing protein [Cellulomonas sp. APG4]